MTNNYRRNHNLPTKRYCGYHKKKRKTKRKRKIQ